LNALSLRERVGVRGLIAENARFCFSTAEQDGWVRMQAERKLRVEHSEKFG